jgi:hypothetical protein
MAAVMFATGKITVPAAGTPVPIPTTAIAGPQGAAGFKSVHAFIIQALSTNTGKIYVGLAGLNKSTLVGVLCVLPIPTANLIPTFSVSLTAAANALALDDLLIDADVNGEGVTVSGVVA